MWQRHFSCCFFQHLGVFGPQILQNKGKRRMTNRPCFAPPRRRDLAVDRSVAGSGESWSGWAACPAELQWYGSEVSSTLPSEWATATCSCEDCCDRPSTSAGVAPANQTKERAKTKSSWISPNFVNSGVFPWENKGDEKFMNFAHFCDFWCFFLGKQARNSHIEFLFRNAPGKSSWTDLSLVWFATGPLLIRAPDYASNWGLEVIWRFLMLLNFACGGCTGNIQTIHIFTWKGAKPQQQRAYPQRA